MGANKERKDRGELLSFRYQGRTPPAVVTDTDSGVAAMNPGIRIKT